MRDLLIALAAIGGTVLVYTAALHLRRRVPSALLNPALVSMLAVPAGLLLLGIDYETYDSGGRLLTWLLGPAVVALGVPLAAEWEAIHRQRRAILTSLTVGSAVGIVTACGVAWLLGAPREIVLSLAPRSVTTPIAMGIAAKLGGLPPLSAVLVISTGALGAIVGPRMLRMLGVRSRTATGLALGAAAHGVGTARALEEGEREGAAAGLAIGIMGLLTAVLAPLLVWIFV